MSHICNLDDLDLDYVDVDVNVDVDVDVDVDVGVDADVYVDDSFSRVGTSMYSLDYFKT